MNKRTIDEMIAHFNQEVSNMDIAREYKMALLGMITAIGYESKKQEVVHGKWIIDAEGNVRCTACKTKCLRDDIGINILSNYCPNCGAKMDGEVKNDEK